MKQLILIAVILLLPSFALAQDFCQGDFNYNGSVGAEDVTVFLAHFGRSQYNNPCPPDGPAPAVWSGQMTSYATGDDGALQKGVHWVIPRFLDNLDGTLTDKATGLIWLRNADCFGQRTWNDALSDCNGLSNGQCGLTDGSSAGDWRLPSIRELHSVIDYSQYNPAIGFFAFLLIQNLRFNIFNYYWSSTTEAPGPDLAWYVYMRDGDVDLDHKIHSFYVWPVRGGR
jgi:hypothetical protein